MHPYHFRKELYYVTQKAVGAVGYLPRTSIYRPMIYKLMQEELPATKYQKLKNRLQRFYKDEWELK